MSNPAPTGQKIVLRRQRNNVIQENLSHMERQAQKKKVAQRIYYETSAAPRQPNRRNRNWPVHARLGNAPMQRLNQNNYATFVKPRTKRLQTGAKNVRNRNVPATFAQNRIDKMVSNFRSTQPNGRQKIILRRKRVNDTVNNSKPCNLTVQVQNVKRNSPGKHSVTSSLNPKLQQEIHAIQSTCSKREVIPNMPIFLGTTGITKTSMNLRFSNL